MLPFCYIANKDSFIHNLKTMVNYGHGNHWECVTDLDALQNGQLQDLITRGNVIDSEIVNGIFFDDENPSQKKMRSLCTPEPELSGLTLIVTDESRKVNAFTSGYPFIKNGTSIKLTIDEIFEWPNKFEAVIRGSLEDGREISFFDTKYFKNKDKYEIGKAYQFVVAALAYKADILKETFFAFEDLKAVEFLSKLNDPVEVNEQGKIEPVTFDLSGLVAFFPNDGPFPDDCTFQSPIESIAKVKFLERNFYKFKIQIYREPDIFINLFAQEDFFKNAPKINAPIRGTLWMQGFLVETLPENKSTSKKNTTWFSKFFKW